MTHRSDAAATQECLASVFTRALAEDRTVEFVPLPKDSVIKRVAASVGKENDARLTGREAQDLLHELEPGLPRYAVRTVRPRLVRVPSTYSTWGPGGRPPCASGTYTAREAGTRRLYVRNGGPGA